MFKRVLSILTAGLIFIGVPGTVLADQEAVIVSVHGSGASDTVLSSADEDITPFLKLHGYDQNMKPLTRKIIGYAEDSTPIVDNDEHNNPTSQSRH